MIGKNGGTTSLTETYEIQRIYHLNKNEAKTKTKRIIKILDRRRRRKEGYLSFFIANIMCKGPTMCLVAIYYIGFIMFEIRTEKVNFKSIMITYLVTKNKSKSYVEQKKKVKNDKNAYTEQKKQNKIHQQLETRKRKNRQTNTPNIYWSQSMKQI